MTRLYRFLLFLALLSPSWSSSNIRPFIQQVGDFLDQKNYKRAVQWATGHGDQDKELKDSTGNLLKAKAQHDLDFDCPTTTEEYDFLKKKFQTLSSSIVTEREDQTYLTLLLIALNQFKDLGNHGTIRTWLTEGMSAEKRASLLDDDARTLHIYKDENDTIGYKRYTGTAPIATKIKFYGDEDSEADYKEIREILTKVPAEQVTIIDFSEVKFDFYKEFLPKPTLTRFCNKGLEFLISVFGFQTANYTSLVDNFLKSLPHLHTLKICEGTEKDESILEQILKDFKSDQDFIIRFRYKLETTLQKIRKK